VHAPAAGAAAGLVPQALRHGLQTELREWFQLIAVLEAQRQSELTLVQLLVWSAEPMQRLIAMVQLVKGCGHLKGGAMCVAMRTYERHGDPALSKHVRQLLRRASAPLLEWLRAWVLRGELHDPHNEFFIEQRAVPNERLWAERYALRDEMLPGFIAKPLAAQALLVGKAINFIRLCCHDAQWTVADDTSGGSGAAVDSLGRLEYGQEEQLQVFVSSAAARANAHLLRLVRGKYMLRQHCANIKHFVLLGKGDFVQYLMERLGPQLSRPTSHLHRHRLLSLLETAVRSCFASEGGGGAASDHVLHHLDIQLLDDPGSSGWDAFSLDYRVEPPVSVVLSADAMVQYRQVFTLLWRLKRVEHSLTALWQKHGTTAHLLRGLRADPLMHACHTLRHEMIHFVYNLQYYLMFEVLECSWDALQAALDGAADLDEVIAAHDAFLQALVSKSLVARSHAPLFGALSQIFEAILSFCKAQDELYLALLEH
jgi:gamma-tubulin complex component 3